MSIKSSVIGEWSFNGSLLDDISTRDFEAEIINNVQFKTLQKFDLFSNKNKSRSALSVQEDQSYSTEGDFSFEELTISFWWYSPDPIGFTRHAVRRDLQSKIAPIIAKANSTSSTGNGSIFDSSTFGADSDLLFQNGTFFINEVASSKTTNKIQFLLADSTSDGSDITHVYHSREYSPGLHHVLITYLQTEQVVRIDIDGKPGIIKSGPSSIHNDTGLLRINDFVPDFDSHKQTQENAYLFDLLLMSIGVDEDASKRIMRYGNSYITDDVLSEKKFLHFGLEYARPSTVSSNQILAEGGNLLVSRSNGKLLKGTRPIWDKEFNYLTPRRVNLLSISETDPSDMDEPEDNSKRIAEWTPSGLFLKGTTVRI